MTLPIRRKLYFDCDSSLHERAEIKDRLARNQIRFFTDRQWKANRTFQWATDRSTDQSRKGDEIYSALFSPDGYLRHPDCSGIMFKEEVFSKLFNEPMCQSWISYLKDGFESAIDIGYWNYVSSLALDLLLHPIFHKRCSMSERMVWVELLMW